MLQRLYINNFRGLDNFELKLTEPSMLLIGRSGSGKSTVARALQILQSIGRGTGRAGQLVTAADCTAGRTDVPLRFEMDLLLDSRVFTYRLALELPEHFHEFRVLEESLSIDGAEAFRRELAKVEVLRPGRETSAFNMDWHLLALPVVQGNGRADPIAQFRNWLAQCLVVLAPVPAYMSGTSQHETLSPEKEGGDFAAWLAGILAQHPAAYAVMFEHLQQCIPDLQEFRNIQYGKNAKWLSVVFGAGPSKLEIPFGGISDGEKCVFLAATVIAANAAYGPLFVFWDEPDNFMPLADVAQFIRTLRRTFHARGQLLATSHNAETIRTFSAENTLQLIRSSHLDPTRVRLLSELPRSEGSDTVSSLLSGEL